MPRKLVLCGPPLLNAAQIEQLKKILQPMMMDRNGRFLTDTWQCITQKEPTAPLDLIYRETLLTLQAGSRYQEAYHAVFAQDFAGLIYPTLLF